MSSRTKYIPMYLLPTILVSQVSLLNSQHNFRCSQMEYISVITEPSFQQYSNCLKKATVLIP